MGASNPTVCFAERIARLHRQLGIDSGYARAFRLQLQQESQDLVSIGADVFGREQQLSAAAARAWSAMQAAAAAEGIRLQVVSAFRPVDYQVALIRKKLEAGSCLQDILKVSAAPGYSEHHSGRALDITTDGFEPLQEAFETSAAFAWLRRSADGFGFALSYPRNNRHGLAYEPWHWCWSSP